MKPLSVGPYLLTLLYTHMASVYAVLMAAAHHGWRWYLASTVAGVCAGIIWRLPHRPSAVIHHSKCAIADLYRLLWIGPVSTKLGTYER